MDRAARRAAERQAIIDGDIAGARRLAEGAVAAGDDLLSVVEEGFAAGIREVGRLWEEGEYFLPELVQGAESMKAAMAIVQPALAASRAGGGAPRGRVVIGTIRGDLHDIGKTLVGTLLAAHGYEVHDLGADVPIEAFVERARDVRADIVAASALLTTTMLAQRDLARAVAGAGFGHPVHVLIGGAPATPAWAAEIGAGYADSALTAVGAADRLLGLAGASAR